MNIRIEQQADRELADLSLATVASDGLLFMDFAALSGQRPPARQWVLTDWLPRRTVTLLAGKGGVGKSLLAQQIATTVRCGMDWLGIVPQPGTVIGLFCEDDHDELWRRQSDICAAHQVPMDQLGGEYQLDARAGKPNALTLFEPHVGIQDTILVEDIRVALRAADDPQLLILDNVAQMFAAGDNGESDRAKVTAFVNRLTGIAIEFNIAVLLLTHPAKVEGSEFSGSTAWENAVRSRLWLFRESDDPNSRVILRRSKANYAARGGDIALVWDKGAFRRDDGRMTQSETVAANSRQRDAEALLLEAIDWLAERKLTASHKKQAGNYLPKQVIGRKLADGYSTIELAAAMDRLIADKRIEVDAFLWKDGNRNSVQGMKRTDTQAADVSAGWSLYKGPTPADTLRSGGETDRHELPTGTQTDRHDVAAYRAARDGET